jgi:hypothetical protein
MVVLILMIALLGIAIFNSKLNLSMPHVSMIILGIVAITFVILMIGYNSHSECDAIINHNNLTLQALQNKCYQYINL